MYLTCLQRTDTQNAMPQFLKTLNVYIFNKRHLNFTKKRHLQFTTVHIQSSEPENDSHYNKRRLNWNRKSEDYNLNTVDGDKTS